MGIRHRLSRLVKRVLLPLLAISYLTFTFFNLHTRNILSNQFGQIQPYKGGVIDDIKRIRCYTIYGQCNQIIEQISIEGSKSKEEIVWNRIDKKLDFNGHVPSAWSLYHDYLYVHYSKPKRFNSPGRAIIDVAIGDPNSSDPPPYVIKDTQTSVGRPRSRLDITYNYNNWDLRQHGIWVKYDKSNAEDAITNINYLFGHEVIEPRLDWTLINGAIEYNKEHPVRLTIRRGKSKNDRETPLLKQKNNEFKVLQISDLHFSSSYGNCNDQIEKLNDESHCKTESTSLNFIHQVLDLEKPELVVFTGDLIDSSNTFDFQTALLKALSPVISRSIPFAIALGETDKSDYSSRYEIIEFIASLPYSLITTKDKSEIGEITNYAIPVYDNENSSLTSMIYILDIYSESDENQATKYLQSAYDKLIEKPKLSLEFQHYPIQEYRPKTSFGIVGDYNYKDKLKVSTDPQTRKVLSDIGVQAMSVGHEHANECCISDDGKENGLNPLWMCFGGTASETASSIGMERRIRVFRINTQEMEITSWKRKHNNAASVFHYQYIHKEKTD